MCWLEMKKGRSQGTKLGCEFTFQNRWSWFGERRQLALILGMRSSWRTWGRRVASFISAAAEMRCAARNKSRCAPLCEGLNTVRVASHMAERPSAVRPRWCLRCVRSNGRRAWCRGPTLFGCEQWQRQRVVPRVNFTSRRVGKRKKKMSCWGREKAKETAGGGGMTLWIHKRIPPRLS